jgi:hypothetical protein
MQQEQRTKVGGGTAQSGHMVVYTGGTSWGSPDPSQGRPHFQFSVQWFRVSNFFAVCWDVKLGFCS